MSRAEAKANAERLGAKVAGTVSSRTDYVVLGQDAAVKPTKPKGLGIEILSEQQWRNLCEDRTTLTSLNIFFRCCAISV